MDAVILAAIGHEGDVRRQEERKDLATRVGNEVAERLGKMLS